jgi:2-polyprenyl-3-methyl-5-hydroxy-6-metoxy-1,4-benzoquinol methylase
MKSWDNTWENVFSNQSWGKYPAESLIRFIARNFYNKDRSNTRILEVGCGPGANIWYLSRENFNVFGIDGSKTAIQLAQKMLDNEKLKATLIEDDIINLPFEKNYFDGIIDVE